MIDHLRFRADHIAYYDTEARHRLRQPRSGWRETIRASFVHHLKTEMRTTVVDFGAGPGFDAAAFADAGLEPLAIDLARENCVLATSRGLRAVRASVHRLPLAPGAFQAGWSMSTLMHLDAQQADMAIRSMAASVEPDGPMWIGLWGSSTEGQVESQTVGTQTRHFFLRTREENRSLCTATAVVECELTPGTSDAAGWEYQLFRLRVEASGVRG